MMLNYEKVVKKHLLGVWKKYMPVKAYNKYSNTLRA